jgi:hypothetical protein
VVVPDALLSALEQSGLDAQVVDREGETVIEIDADSGEDALAKVESVLGELELPLVPEQADGKIYVRPPAA